MASPPARKSKGLFSKGGIFKRPTAKPNDAVTTSLFSRSDSTYGAVVVEEERRMAKRQAKAARRAQELRKREGNTDNAGKRRRISVPDSISSSSSESEQERKSNNTRSSPTSPPPLTALNCVRLSIGKYGDIFGGKDVSAKHDAEVINLDEDGSEETILPSAKGTQTKRDTRLGSGVGVSQSQAETIPKPEDPGADSDGSVESLESDVELAELKRKAKVDAREKMEQARLKREAGTNTSQGSNAVPSICLIIDSQLPGAERLTFKRRLDQCVRALRLRWCEQNSYDAVEEQNIILVFRGRRVFDVQTPRNLGISIDEQGVTRVKGDDPMNPPDGGDIVLYAIMEASLESYEAEYARKGRGLDDVDDVEDDYEDEVSEVSPQKVDLSIKIICRARDYTDLKLAVKTSTPVSQLQLAFANANQLSPNSIVQIMFDGELLSPNTTIEELGLEDRDILDVQIR